jgi:hypothetical protein
MPESLPSGRKPSAVGDVSLAELLNDTDVAVTMSQPGVTAWSTMTDEASCWIPTRTPR